MESCIIFDDIWQPLAAVALILMDLIVRATKAACSSNLNLEAAWEFA
jgi:ubiquitin-protein ligase